MMPQTATRPTERGSGRPGQEIVTVSRNNTTTAAKNQVLFDTTTIMQAFQSDIVNFGLTAPANIEPGRIFRCRAEGKKTGYPGWGVIHMNPDGTAGGCIGNHVTGDKQKVFYGRSGEHRNYHDLTPDERAAFQKMIDEAKTKAEADQKARYAKAAAAALRIWNNAKPADPGHRYAKDKGINLYDARQTGKTLLIPRYNAAGHLMSLQYIYPDGFKKNQTDGQTTGGFFIIGDPDKSDIIYVCEGFATGASIHEATGQAVMVAFTANNLDAVTGIGKKRHPEKKIIIASDNDIETSKRRPDLGNPGRKAAEAAAAAHGVRFTICPMDSDFNDLHKIQGLDAVRAALKKTRPVTGSEPIPLPDELTPVMPFDYELLPERLRAWVQDIAERMQCPPDFVAVTVMTAMAAVIGRKVGIRPQARTDWTVVCNLWALIVGRPGVLKSPAQEAGLSPLKRLIATANERYQEQVEAYEGQALAAKLRKEAAEKKARQVLQKDPNADLKTVLAVGEEPVFPVLKRYKSNDSTPASLGELLRQNPNGLLVYRDEVVSLLKGLDREGQEEGRGFYLTAWNGDSPYTFDRIGRGLNLHIPALCISLLGGTQPGRLSEYISQAVKGGSADDGLIQRFGLLVWPDMNGTWKNVDRYPDTEAKNRAFQVFDELDKLDLLDIGADQDTDFEGQPDGIPYLRFEPAALELFTEWRTALESKLRSDLHPALESHYAKYRKLIPSLALIIHLADGGTGPVSEDATLRALAWGEYLETHAERAYSSVSKAEVSTAKAILRRIKKGDLKPPFTSHAVWRPGWSKLSDRNQVMGGLRMLEDYNHIYTEKVETGGRAKTLYHLNEGE
jgi:putative DNA primase/helicase